MEPPHVTSVRALDDFRLEVLFENSERRIFDVKPYMTRGVFTRLRNRSLFKAVRVIAGSVEWPGEIDLSYETLYIESEPIAPASEADQTDSSDAHGTRADHRKTQAGL